VSGPDETAAAVTVERPADFDAFWSQTLREAAEIPLDESVTYSPVRSTGTVAVYEVRYTSWQGVRVAGWYTVPRGGGTPGPALLVIPGYISDPPIPKRWSARGYAALSLAPRGKLGADAVVNPGFPGLLTHHIADRHAYGYRGCYVDVVRGLDLLRGRPEVDPDRIGVYGSSQGGGLGIVTAALRPDAVRCVVAGCPFLCGIADAPRLTHSYPYQEITEYLRVHPDHRALVRETVSYYDCVNFAPAVRAPVLVHLGLADDVCPPETGFAVHRALGGPTRLHTYPRCGHDAGRHWVQPLIEEFLAGHLVGA
jgi:cephalosporin-C deacetylase